jgi:hypothetical protein
LNLCTLADSIVGPAQIGWLHLLLVCIIDMEIELSGYQSLADYGQNCLLQTRPPSRRLLRHYCGVYFVRSPARCKVCWLSSLTQIFTDTTNPKQSIQCELINCRSSALIHMGVDATLAMKGAVIRSGFPKQHPTVMHLQGMGSLGLLLLGHTRHYRTSGC